MSISYISSKCIQREKSHSEKRKRERNKKQIPYSCLLKKKNLLSLLNKSFLKAPSDIHCDRENSHQQQLAAKEYWAALSSSQEMGILGSKSFYTGWKCPFFFYLWSPDTQQINLSCSIPLLQSSVRFFLSVSFPLTFLHIKSLGKEWRCDLNLNFLFIVAK